jgi:7-cyano-7-deazaguanine reductase
MSKVDSSGTGPRVKVFECGVKEVHPERLNKKMEINMNSLERIYGIVSRDLELERVETDNPRKPLDVFKSPGKVLIDIEFPEFTCLCPKTNQPDFGTFRLVYIPDKVCVELKSLKYYLNSFRTEGHFHEQVAVVIRETLEEALKPIKLEVIIEFNFRGGLTTTVHSGDSIV